MVLITVDRLGGKSDSYIYSQTQKNTNIPMASKTHTLTPNASHLPTKDRLVYLRYTLICPENGTGNFNFTIFNPFLFQTFPEKGPAKAIKYRYWVRPRTARSRDPVFTES